MIPYLEVGDADGGGDHSAADCNNEQEEVERERGLLGATENAERGSVNIKTLEVSAETWRGSTSYLLFCFSWGKKLRLSPSNSL